VTNSNSTDGTWFDWYGVSPSGVEMALHVSIGDVPDMVLDDGEPVDRLEALMRTMVRLDKRLAASGFTRSERLSKPATRSFPPKRKEPVTLTNEDGETVVVTCRKCGGPVWDNRADKRNPKAPDFKCRDKACGAGIWLDRASARSDG
jgi:hypothetical protein